MRCKQTIKWADEYLSGTLHEEGKQEMERHMDRCRPCALYVEELRQMLMLVSELDQEELPPGFEQRLQQRLQQADQKAAAKPHPDGSWVFRHHNRWMKWGAGLATILTLVFTVYLIQPFGFRNSGSGGPGNDGNLTTQDNITRESTEYGMYSGDMESPMSDAAPSESSLEMRQNDTPMNMAREAESADEHIRAAEQPAEIYLYVSRAEYISDEIAAIAADYEITVVQQQNNQMVLQITDEMQVKAFLEELSQLGRVERSNRNAGEGSITIQIILE